MPLTFRLIARLDIRNANLIKTIRMEGVRVVGDPGKLAKSYDRAGIDELVYLDVVASLYGRNTAIRLVDDATAFVFCPVSVAGGIASIRGANDLFRAGADKVAANTGFHHNPKLITEFARKFGSQAVVLQLDAKRKNGGWEAYCDGGRQPTGRDALAWAAEAVERGCGEILVTSIDREGMSAGFDLDLTGELSCLPVPVVTSGGFGAPRHAVEAYEAGASGIAIAGALHYNKVRLDEIRAELKNAGINVRCAPSLPEPAASSVAI